VRPTPSTTATFNGTVRAIAYSGTTAYIGGDFSAAYWNGGTYSRTRLAAINVTTGALLSWSPKADKAVRAIAVSGSTVYIGGDFGVVSGVTRRRVAGLAAATGALRAAPNAAIYGQVYSLAVGNGRLYLGGRIAAIGSQARSNLAALAQNSGALDGTWKPRAEDRVEAVVFTSGRVYVGGIFSNVSGVARAAGDTGWT